MATNPIFVFLAAFRARLEKREAQAFNVLVDAYRGAYGRLGAELELLARQALEEGLTRGQIAKMDRYKRVMGDVAQELQALQALTTVETDKAARLGIDLGLRDARELLSVAATGDPRYAAAFKTLPKDAVETLIGFLAPDSPLYQRLRLIAPYNAGLVSDTLISGVAAGFNPRKIATMTQNAFGGGLTDAMRFVRTAQLYSYRDATRATYIANGDILEGWIWHAALDQRVCMSCIAQHGTIHPVDERLNDHHAGRCAAVPLVKGFANPVTESGAAWFDKQSAQQQRLLMGKSAHAAWLDGKFAVGDMSTERQDAIYGMMRSVKPLKELVRD